MLYGVKGGTRRKPSRRTTSFGPADVFVGIICGRTRQKRSLVNKHQTQISLSSGDGSQVIVNVMFVYVVFVFTKLLCV
jgi:hypothetical protein